MRGGSGGSLTSLPGVLSASSFPRVRSAASAAAATASPTSPASRGAAAAAGRAATTTLSAPATCSLFPLAPPTGLGRARTGETAPEAAARPSQPPAHNPPRGSAGAGELRPRPQEALAASAEGLRRGRSRRAPGAVYTPRVSSARPLTVLHANTETHAELHFSPRPFPHPEMFSGTLRCRLPPSLGLGPRLPPGTTDSKLPLITQELFK